MKKAENLLKLTIFAGIILILGTAGASDLGRLTAGECLSKLFLGIAMISGGGTGLKIVAALKSAGQRRTRVYRCAKQNFI